MFGLLPLLHVHVKVSLSGSHRLPLGARFWMPPQTSRQVLRSPVHHPLRVPSGTLPGSMLQQAVVLGASWAKATLARAETARRRVA